MSRFGLGLLFIIGAVGCGGPSDGPNLAPVSGTVIVGGKPRGNLNVAFFPEGGGRPATGTTDESGHFTLTTNNTGDGAIIGRNKAAISGASDDSQYGEAGPPMPGFPGFEEWQKKQREMLDPKYGDPEKSGLVYTVPEEGMDDLEIKIQ